MRENISQVQSRCRNTAAAVQVPLSRFPRHAALCYLLTPSPLLSMNCAFIQTSQTSFFQAKHKEGNLILEAAISVPLPNSQGICTLDCQHVWKHLHLREQLLNHEAHQVKREKQADRWNSVPAHADWMYKHWQWHSVFCAPAGHKCLIKTEFYTDPPVGKGK